MLARAVLATGVAVCLATWFFGAEIPYFDYDDATQGIFVNDLAFGRAYAASFEGLEDRQNRYRVGFAAQRLAYSLPLSLVQRGLALERWQVEDLLRAAALAFAFAGSCFAALTLLPAPRFGLGERAGMVAALAAHPALALFARTGASFYVFAYALFWLGCCCGCRWLDTGRSAWLWSAAGVAALCALNPYPPLVAWPLGVAAAALARGQLGALLRRRQLYAAALVAAFLAAAATALLGIAFDDSLARYFERLAQFHADRGHSLGLAQLFQASPLDKLHELLDQQLWFAPNALGDRSRDDSVWQLGAPSPAVWILALAALRGIAAGLRERDAADLRALALAGALLALLFTIAFPEGRFALALLPCWVYFALRGLEATRIPRDLRGAALGALCLLLAVGTELALRGNYLPRLRPLAARVEGMRDAARALAAQPDRGRATDLVMPAPPHWVPALTFRMLMPEGAAWIGPRRLAERLAEPDSERVLAVVAYADDASISELERAGLQPSAELRGEVSGRVMRLLLRTAAPRAPQPLEGGA
jgi:hypothetical protein